MSEIQKRRRRSEVEAEVQAEAKKRAKPAGNKKQAGRGRVAIEAAKIRQERGIPQPEFVAHHASKTILFGAAANAKYDPSFPGRLIDYFANARAWWTNYTEKGAAQVMPKDRLPNLGRWAREEIGVSVSTLYVWCEQYPDFALAYAEALDIQKEFLSELGASGAGSANFAVFLLKSVHGLRDNVIEVDGDDDADEVEVVATGAGQAK